MSGQHDSLTNASSRGAWFLLAASLLAASLVACAPQERVVPVPVDGEEEAEPGVAPGRLVLNEVNCASNPVEWVELFNAGGASIDTRGFSVVDKIENLDAAIPVPPGTIPPGGFRVVQTDLRLSCSGDGAVLVRDGVVVDEAPVRAGDADLATWGRLPDGTGAFTLVGPTPARANIRFPDERDSVFAAPSTNVPTIDVYVDADAESSLRNAGKGAGYVPALFSWTDPDGTSTPPQRVDLRIKGSITLRSWDDKPSVKVNFARHNEPGPHDFRGLRKLTMNNLTYDPSFIRERLAYEFMRESGHPGARVSWARVRVNGQEKGLYSLIETYDSVFLADHYESTQVMYESDGSVGVGELGGFDVDEGPDDFGPLNGLADRLARTPFDGTSDLQRVFPEVDWRQIARINALEDILAHFDGDRGACHNFFLHLDGEGRWTLLPWSVDLSLVTNGFASGPLGSCMKLSVLCDADAQCRAWFLRDRDTAAQLALRGDWEARVTAWATPLAPFAKATNEPFRGNEFWPPDVGTDVVQNARDAVNLLRERAASIRCATAVARGEPAPGANETCGGFVLSSDQENRSGNLP